MKPITLECLHCQSPLQRVRKPNNIYWACSRCGGRSSTIALMRRMMPKELINRLWQDARHSNAPRLRSCPACQQKMAQLSVPGQPFMIDVCRTCTLVWFDPAEYDALPKTPPAPHPHREEDLPPKARQILAMNRIDQRRDQAWHEKQSPDGFWKYVPAILGMPVEFDYGHPSHKPYATWTIALLIGLISLLAFMDLETVVRQLALIPEEWSRLSGFTFFTSVFLHANLLHLVGNLYFLLVFGDNVEDDLGSAWFMFLLLFSVLIGGLVHVLTHPGSAVPCIGASGGVSALLAYYALQFPKARVGFLFFFRWVRLPVLAYVFFWVALQVVGTQIPDSGVAYGAHLGGAAAGLMFWLFQKICRESR
jgi:membrane associated rhomboid family serine protease